MPIASKDFHKQRKVTGILTIDVNKFLFSRSVSCNKEKDWQRIAGYQVDGGNNHPCLEEGRKHLPCL